MKKFILVVMSLAISFTSVFAQENSPTPPDWSGWIYKNGPPQEMFKYVGLPVDITLEVKNDTGVVRYIEHFSTTIGIGGYVKVTFGTGTIDPNSPVDNYFDAFYYSKYICPSIVIHDPEGDIFISGFLQDFSSTPKALFAQEANNATALGGNTYVGGVHNFTQEPDILQTGNLLVLTPIGNPPIIDVLSLADLFENATVNSAVTGTPLNILQVNPVPSWNGISFGPAAPVEGESKISICSQSSPDFFNVFGVKALGGHSPSLNHATAAIYAENIEDELGVGLNANGSSRGTYSQGQTGVLGLSNGTGNGAGVWARVQTEPAPGSFKYGLYAENQSLPNTYAAYLNGNSIYTGTLTQTSDARLKTHISESAYGLSTVLKLRPSQYQYLENTPYNFPQGTHQGFLAQDVEEVLPELVSDVIMPNNFDPEQISTSGTTSYKTVNYIEMIPILTTAIQELNAKVDAQSVEISQLKKELEAISKNK